VKVLLKAKAKVEVQDKDGKTPRDFAQSRDNAEMVKLLDK